MGCGEVGGSLEREGRGQAEAPLSLVEGECGWRVQRAQGAGVQLHCFLITSAAVLFIFK